MDKNSFMNRREFLKNFATISSLSTASILLSGCSPRVVYGPPADYEDRIIEQMIHDWIGFLETGDETNLKSLFDPDYWNDCQTKSDWSVYTGQDLDINNIEIIVTDNSAMANFVLIHQGNTDINIEWSLSKLNANWLISSEEWI
jgi:hypothetical protein